MNTPTISTDVARQRDRHPAVIVLEDGYALTGRSYGATGTTTGPLSVTTAVTGYQETLTDASRAGDVVLFTAPHVGNTGVNDDDARSGSYQAAGIVLREPARRASSWLAARELEADLREAGVVGVCHVDTRALARHLREHGPLRAAVVSGPDLTKDALANPSTLTHLFDTEVTA